MNIKKRRMEDHGEAEFAHLIVTIEPWLKKIVVIGGWAYRLYCLDPSALKPKFPPLMTLDVDLAMPRMFEHDHQDIRGKLLSNGFQEDQLGEDAPPVTHYRLREAKSGFYAEFLTPLIGSEYGRDGVRKATHRVAGVVSQQLRHLDILLQAPWTASLDRANGFPFDGTKYVQIANPVSFLAHKLLIHEKRKAGQFTKDIIYIYDTLNLFGAQLQKLNEEWESQIKPQLHRRSICEIQRASENMFGQVYDPIREAAQISPGRRLSPEAIRESCHQGLMAIFS